MEERKRQEMISKDGPREKMTSALDGRKRSSVFNEQFRARLRGKNERDNVNFWNVTTRASRIFPVAQIKFQCKKKRDNNPSRYTIYNPIHFLSRASSGILVFGIIREVIGLIEGAIFIVYRERNFFIDCGHLVHSREVLEDDWSHSCCLHQFRRINAFTKNRFRPLFDRKIL